MKGQLTPPKQIQRLLQDLGVDAGETKIIDTMATQREIQQERQRSTAAEEKEKREKRNETGGRGGLDQCDSFEMGGSANSQET